MARSIGVVAFDLAARRWRRLKVRLEIAGGHRLGSISHEYA
jgi:hypothetical protein